MSKRNHIHGFERNYGSLTQMVDLDIKDAGVQENINRIFLDWESSRGKVREDTEIELEAVKRLFKMEKTNNFQCLGLMIENKMVGFSVCELLANNYAMYHFEKADVEYKGIFAYLKHKTAEELWQKGVAFWNLEQDLGDNGLRISKSECQPVKMLKKYVVGLTK